VKLSIILPARNERDTILEVIRRVRTVDCGMDKELIVVDGASSDGTREALLDLGDATDLVLVLEEEARGKGRAVRTGFEHASGDVVMIQDGDLELDPGEIPSLLEPIIQERADVVFGSRFKRRGRGATPLLGYAGNLVMTKATNLLYRTRLTDTLTCYKVMRGDIARTLELSCNGFDFDAEITCRLLRDGHDILELPVTYNARSTAEGKKLGPGAGWSVLWAILRVRFGPRGRRLAPQSAKRSSRSRDRRTLPASSRTGSSTSSNVRGSL
jgi:glycosyltransferase involved in cell wall biosynthesis